MKWLREKISGLSTKIHLQLNELVTDDEIDWTILTLVVCLFCVLSIVIIIASSF